MPKESIRMSKQVRPSELEVVSLDDSQERRFRKLEEEAVMIDLHEHPMVKPEDPNLFLEYLGGGDYKWGYEAIRHGLSLIHI